MFTYTCMLHKYLYVYESSYTDVYVCAHAEVFLLYMCIITSVQPRQTSRHQVKKAPKSLEDVSKYIKDFSRGQRENSVMKVLATKNKRA